MTPRHLLLYAALIFCILTPFDLFAQQKNFLDQPYIEVSGEADTLITPDQIFLSISLSEKDTKNRTAAEDLESKMIKAIQKLGIDVEKKLTVINMISDYRDYLLKKTDILKSKKYELEVNNADIATNVLVALEELEISNIHVSRLGHSHMKAIENTVRIRSVANAHEKAIALVTPLNQKIGRAVHINESPGGNPLPQSSANLNEVAIHGYMLQDTRTKTSSNVNFRQLKVVKAVTVKFILQ